MRKTLYDVLEESTCQKRLTIVEIYDREGHLLSRESNRCSPASGACSRLNIDQTKDQYDVISHCNWTHAEIMALNAITDESKPYKAILLGHNFYCDSCEAALRKAGVEVLEIRSKDYVKQKLNQTQATFDDLLRSNMLYNESYYFYLWGKIKVYEKLLKQL